MTVQPDIIWNEQCLGIRISEQICNYLKKHDAEYQSEYSCAAEPPVQCSVSHLSRRSEPQ